MDFTIPPDLAELQARTGAFIRNRIVPLETDARQTRHGPTDAFRRELNALAEAEGLLAPHVAPEYGGLGLDHVGKALIFEEAGYSPLGPLRSPCGLGGTRAMMIHVRAPCAPVINHLRPLMT